MTSADDYLSRVKRALIGVDAGMRADILAELENHLADAISEAGGDASEALRGMESPKELARRYREVYGFGTPFKALLLAFAAVLVIPTLTMPWMTDLGVLDPAWMTAIFLLVTAVYLIWVSIIAGKVIGALTGAAACVARLVTLGILLMGGGTLVDAGGLGLVGFLAVSLALILVGYLPGDRKEKWRRAETTL